MTYHPDLESVKLNRAAQLAARDIAAVRIHAKANAELAQAEHGKATSGSVIAARLVTGAVAAYLFVAYVVAPLLGWLL